MIFQWEQSQAPVEQVIQSYWGSLAQGDDKPPAIPDPLSDRLLCGVVKRSAEIDGMIKQHAENWRLERMAAVDRNVLRMAIYELIEGSAAPAVVMDEAIEIGRKYSGDEAARFLNGVLDAISKTITTGKPPKSENKPEATPKSSVL
jgi:N utilization substance protein B